MIYHTGEYLILGGGYCWEEGIKVQNSCPSVWALFCEDRSLEGPYPNTGASGTKYSSDWTLFLGTWTLYREYDYIPTVSTVIELNALIAVGYDILEIPT